ncbi:hypothetical protein KDK95_16020 [Actinospica sp. MGRD01-02]|uniref:ATP/GTP-binding protein n=1 Tax=Actinospica acidithermotolerans TaxID=2828514 RepID=A0A941ECA2_9ACTN|nr:hypothetical protein [Actinospica acidithermotolerans]MBR7827827.1 hypothetical protein [Actinospica acidithermotolerans]
MTRRFLFVAIVIALIASCTQAAFANSGGGTQCDPTVESCTITASSPGSPGQTPSPSPQSGDAGGGSGSSLGSGSGGAAASPTLTIVNGACTYQADPSYQPPAGVTPGKKPGAWYLMTCPDAINSNNIASTTTQVVWVPNGTLPTAPALPAPAVLAAEAQRKLKLPDPMIESNPAPGHPQLVSVPMWSWVPTSQFTAQSATASVPGESVTATAKPVSVTWSWGDETSTTCSGPGTPYSNSDAANTASPTCGHTYTKDSGRGDFTVSATITWNVTWAGSGQSGAFNGMTTTATEAVHVEQSRALVTGG